MFLGILVLITALSISAVAIYYSVAGLVAIFAAAALPIIIMGSVLEIGKLVTAVWLHRYWKQATWWLKTYLSISVIVLMFITSMGIFGFLSKAHIDQTAQAVQSVEQISQIQEQILREQSVIKRANIDIDNLQTQDSSRDQEIQLQIDREQQRIDTAYERIEPALQEQRDIIQARQVLREQRIKEVEAEIESAKQGLNDLDTALSERDIRRAQSIVGTRVDGSFGPGTERAIAEYRSRNQTAIDPLQQKLETIRTEVDTQEQAARDEIARLRQFAEKQIQDSNTLIARLRSQIGTANREEIEQNISEQRNLIEQSNQRIDGLIEQKYRLETEYRKLEAEVGPVKYLAEFIYGDTADKDLLEEAVRWVIVVIIFVFDPLAVLLLIASQYTFEFHKKKRENSDQEEEENNVNFIRSNMFRSVENHSESGEIERFRDYTDSGNRKFTNSGNVESIRTGTNDEGRDLSTGMGEETIDVFDIAKSIKSLIIDVPNVSEIVNEYKLKKNQNTESTEDLNLKNDQSVLTLEEQRALEYKQKENSEKFNNDKEAWKHDHPDQTLKMYKTLYINGKIDKLPWEGYVQNSEQKETSLFNKLKQRPESDND